MLTPMFPLLLCKHLGRPECMHATSEFILQKPLSIRPKSPQAKVQISTLLKKLHGVWDDTVVYWWALSLHSKKLWVWSPSLSDQSKNSTKTLYWPYGKLASCPGWERAFNQGQQGTTTPAPMTQSVRAMIKENGFRLQKSGIMLNNMYVPEKTRKHSSIQPHVVEVFWRWLNDPCCRLWIWTKKNKDKPPILRKWMRSIAGTYKPKCYTIGSPAALDSVHMQS